MAAWDQLDLTERHIALLQSSAITPDVAAAAGIRSATERSQLPDEFAEWPAILPALVFPWRSITGTVLHQIRPDRADDDPDAGKYLTPKGVVPVFDMHPAVAERVADPAAPLVIVEGTKQHLSAISHLGDLPHAVLGMAGCYGWSTGHNPIPCLDAIAWRGREIVLLLDADRATNRDVYDAACELAETLELRGAKAVRYARLPGGGTNGLDDILATLADPADGLARILDKASDRPGRRPPAARKSRYLDTDGGLLVATLAQDIDTAQPMLLADDYSVAVYRDGYYHTDQFTLSGHVSARLGEAFRKAHLTNVEEYLIGQLVARRSLLPDKTDLPVLNVANGMLHLDTGQLDEHDPRWHSAAQIPIVWDPNAACPIYQQWLADVAGSQADALEEVAATMLDPRSTPTKAIFLYGPSRSGKSTFLRIMRVIVGQSNCSAVTLQQLATDRFATANVFGKMLNAAGDLPASHLADISVFKQLTGEDIIHADRKFGRQFTFTNRALFAFSANEVPSTAENTRAYSERIMPFRFDTSFAGCENPKIEQAMMSELPGILARWVAAWQRMAERGFYPDIDPEVRQDFDTRSDRVHLWLAEQARVVTEVDGDDGGRRPVGSGTEVPASAGATKRDLYHDFVDWSKGVGTNPMAERKFIDRLISARGVCEVRLLPRRTRGLNVVLDPGQTDEDDRTSARAGRSSADSGSFSNTSARDGETASPGKTPDDTGSTGRAGSFEHLVMREKEQGDPVDVSRARGEEGLKTARSTHQPVSAGHDTSNPRAEVMPTVGLRRLLRHYPEPTPTPCPHCDTTKELMPPSNTLRICPSCFPHSFQHPQRLETR